MKTINLLSSTKLLLLSIGMIMGAFVMLSMALPEDSNEGGTSGPHRSHWTSSGSCGSTNYNNKIDYGKAIAQTMGNGSVSIEGENSTSASTNNPGTTSGTESYVTWNCGYNGEGNHDDLTAKHSNRITLTATPADGYMLDRWENAADETVSNEAIFTTVVSIPHDNYGTSQNQQYESSTSPYTERFIAYFKEKEVTRVTMSAPVGGTYTYTCTEGNGTVSTEDVYIDTENELTFTATPSTGYRFWGWYTLDGEDEVFFSYTNPTSKIFGRATTIYAKFIPDTWALFSIKNGDGTQYYDLNAANTAASGSSSKTIVLEQTGTLAPGDYTISSGNTLLVPCENTNKVSTTTCTYSTSDKAISLYRKLTMEAGTTITVNGSLCVNVEQIAAGAGGSMAGRLRGAFGQIDMKTGSEISIESGANLYAWGYITGQGNVIARSGAQVYEVLQFDFRGGSHVSKVMGTVLPLNQYYVQNIEAHYTVYSGVTEKVFTAAYAGGMSASASTNFIASDGLFILNSGAHLERYYDGSTDRIEYDLFGSCKLNCISVKVVTYSLDSKNTVLPLTNNMTIRVHSGTTTIGYKTELLADARIEIDEDAILDIQSNFFIYDRDEWVGQSCAMSGDLNQVTYAPGRTYTSATNTGRTGAKMVDAAILVNGILKTSSSGYIYTTQGGANIYSTGNGKVILANGTGSITSTKQNTATAQTTHDVPVTPAQLMNADGTYYSTSGQRGEIPYDPIRGKWGIFKTYIVHYNNNGGVGSMPDATHTVGEATTLDACTFTRDGYEFMGWATTASGDKMYDDEQEVNTINNEQDEITLYAKWRITPVGEPLDIVDWTDGEHAVINVTSCANWNIYYGANYWGKRGVSGDDRNPDRTLTIPVTDLNPNDEFVLTAKDAGDVVRSKDTYKVPYVVTTNTNISALTVTGTTNIYVRSGATLTIDQPTELNAIYVQPNAKLVIAEDQSLSLDRLVLRTKAFENTPEFTKEPGADFTCGHVYYTRVVTDNTQYLPFAIPMNCTIANVTLSDGTTPTYGTHWVLRSYSESSRATNGPGDNWENVSTTIEGCKGYEMFSNSAYYREYYFPVNFNATSFVNLTKSDGEESDAGWNNICSPLTDSYTVNMTTDDFLTISELRQDGTYNQHPADVIRPAIPFFYQTEVKGKLMFTDETQVVETASAPHRINVHTTAEIQPQWIRLFLTDSIGRYDETDIFTHPDYFTPGYDTKYDLEKLSLTGRHPLIYAVQPIGNLAFTALPDSLAEQIMPIAVHAPHAGEYTFSLRETNFMSRAACIYLYDTALGTTTDLLMTDYTCTIAEGTASGRFAIRVLFRAPSIATDVENVEVEADGTKKIYHNGQIYLLRDEHIYDIMGREAQLK